MGLTAGSRFLVRKSKKILGQKNASSAAPTWSGGCQYLFYVAMAAVDVQNAAARTMRRPQWFLINLPMLLRRLVVRA